MPARAPRIPADPFARARRQFSRWRSSGSQRRRFPEDLWALAVGLAADHGVSKTSGELRLDYYSLKKRLDAATARSPAVATPKAPAFVEIPFLPRPTEPGCVIELRDPSGLQMRVELHGAAVRELPSVALALWRGAR